MVHDPSYIVILFLTLTSFFPASMAQQQPPEEEPPRLSNYDITVYVKDDKRGRIAFADMAILNDGAEWVDHNEGMSLKMAQSGTSGILVMRSTNQELFTIAFGVHNWRRWLDLKINLTDPIDMHTILNKYYETGTDESAVRWRTPSSMEHTTSKGNTIRVVFTSRFAAGMTATVYYNKLEVAAQPQPVEPPPDFGTDR